MPTPPETSLSDVFIMQGHLKGEEGQLSVGQFFFFFEGDSVIREGVYLDWKK